MRGLAGLVAPCMSGASGAAGAADAMDVMNASTTPNSAARAMRKEIGIAVTVRRLAGRTAGMPVQGRKSTNRKLNGTISVG